MHDNRNVMYFNCVKLSLIAIVLPNLLNMDFVEFRLFYALTHINIKEKENIYEFTYLRVFL